MSYNKISPLQKFTPTEWSKDSTRLDLVSLFSCGSSGIKSYGSYDYERHKSSYDSYKPSSSSYDSQQSTNQILSSYMQQVALM